jgi:hypothetical protein
MLKFFPAWWMFSLPCIALLGCDLSMKEFEIGPDGKMVEVEPEAEDPVTENKNEDEFVTKELLANKDEYAEAKEWLLPKHENHKLWKGNREAITKLVDDLYTAGAAKVYAVGFEKDDEVQVVAMFVAELPTEAATRKKVIERHNKFWKEYLSEVEEEELATYLVKDTGQKYVVSNFDL